MVQFSSFNIVTLFVNLQIEYTVKIRLYSLTYTVKITNLLKESDRPDKVTFLLSYLEDFFQYLKTDFYYS